MTTGRRSGADGYILVDLTSTAGGTLTTLSYFNKWTVGMTRDKIEVTCSGDASKKYVTGLPDQAIQIDGFANVGADQLDVLNDGKARGLTIVPTASITSTQFSGGKYVFDCSYSGGVAEGIAFSLTTACDTSGSWTSI